MTNGSVPLIHLDAVTKVFVTDEVETHALAGIHIDIKKGVIWIRAARNIQTGEELTYDYNTDGDGLIKCRCSPGCQRLI